LVRRSRTGTGQVCPKLPGCCERSKRKSRFTKYKQLAILAEKRSPGGGAPSQEMFSARGEGKKNKKP